MAAPGRGLLGWSATPTRWFSLMAVVLTLLRRPPKPGTAGRLVGERSLRTVPAIRLEPPGREFGWLISLPTEDVYS